MKKDSSKLPTSWIFLPGLILAALLESYLWLNSSGGLSWQALRFPAIVLVLAGPSVVGLVCRICRWRVTWQFAFVTVGLYWAWVLVLAIITFSSFYGLFVFGMVLVPFFVTTVVTTAWMGLRMGPLWAFAAVGGGLFCGIIVILVSMGWAMDKKRWPGKDPVPLAPDLVTIDKCAHQFAALHPEVGYPQSLQQLGLPGSGCLPDALLKDEDKGFSLIYLPGEKDSQGKVTTYMVKAEQMLPHGPEFSTMFTDESGVVLSREHGPRGKVFPQLHSAVGGDIYFLLADCLHGETSRTMADAEAADQAFQKCARGFLSQYAVSSGSFVSAWSKITYRFERNASGAVEGFTADVRPITYGDVLGGIRSYLIEQKFGEHATTLRMYGTPEDRPANTSDPLADVCEMQARPAFCGHFAAKTN